MKAYTYGFGELELLTDEEDYKYTKGYNDAVVDGRTYTVAEGEENGKMIEVRQREDGSLFAVFTDF